MAWNQTLTSFSAPLVPWGDSSSLYSSDDILKQGVELSSEKGFILEIILGSLLPQGFKENKQFRLNQVDFFQNQHLMGVLWGPAAHPHLSVSSYDDILFCLWMSCDLEHLRMLRVQNESNLMELFCEYCLFVVSFFSNQFVTHYNFICDLVLRI